MLPSFWAKIVSRKRRVFGLVHHSAITMMKIGSRATRNRTRTHTDSTDLHGAAGPQPNSGYLGVPRACGDGPAGRLYGAPASSEILALLERILLGEILGALCAFAVMV